MKATSLAEVTLFCDLDRRLPVTDPFDRRILISLGCFVELFRMAAAEEKTGAQIAAYPDGVALGGPMIEDLLARNLLKVTDLSDPASNAFQMMLKLQSETALATPAYVWTTSVGDSRAAQLMAGRDWLRLNLAATQLGLGFHPMSQRLQEFPEMAKSYADIREALAVPADQTVQLLARLGRPLGQSVRSALRWPIESRIMRG